MQLKHPDKLPCLVFANRRGEIKDFSELAMAGRSGYQFLKPTLTDIIPLPAGSDIFVMPDHLPVGIDPQTDEPLLLEQSPDDPAEGIQGVAAFMAPAYTATYWAGCKKTDNNTQPLPLFAYTAVGWYQDKFWVCAFRSDPDTRQEVSRYNLKKLTRKTNKWLEKYSQNRLVQHLGKCSLIYQCPAAVNFFLGQGEAPLPTSPICNARCAGCISLQPSGCCPSTQDRIKFIPDSDEIAEVALSHLDKVKNGVVSFGQGCEGEPLLQADIIEQAIKLIRQKVSQGTINLNSNGSLPEAVNRLAQAGLNSLRVSINSCRQEFYNRYYRPVDFSFDDVLESIAVMKRHGGFVSLNYFILPGFTDDPDEFTALCGLVAKYKPDMIQLRNLNMDMDWYLDVVNHAPTSQPLSIRGWLAQLATIFPDLRFGYFNPALYFEKLPPT